jgi:hypothetical protein
MTRDELDSRVEELLEGLDIKKEMTTLVAKVLNQGAVNLEGYENNYLLPKILLFCAFESYAREYFKPPIHNKEAQKEIKNIKYFI